MTNITKTRGLHLTYVDAVKTTKTLHVVKSWTKLAIELTGKPVVNADRDAVKWPLFVPFKMLTIEEGARTNDWGSLEPLYSRCTENVVHADVMVLDIDNDPKNQLPSLTVAEAIERFKGYAFALYTSFNHLNPNKGNVEKFRIVLPLKDAISYDDLRERKSALIKLFPFIDTASFSISQPFYRPIVRPGAEVTYRSHEGSGEWFDLLAINPVVIEKPNVIVTLTDRPHADSETLIRTKDLGILTAAALYDQLQEGYAHKVNCYKIDGVDKKPSSFIYRRGSGLQYIGTGDANRFIQVLRVIRRDVDDGPSVLPKFGSALNKPTPKPIEQPATVKPLIEFDAHNPSLILPVAEREASKIGPNTYSLNLNSRYLPDDLHGFLPSEGISIIRSPKGTGKTELLKHIVSDARDTQRSVLLLGHRIHLLRNLSQRTDLTNYQDVEASTTNHMALCINSLKRVVPGQTAPYDTVIIDESEQVLSGLIAETVKSDINSVFSSLTWCIKNAKRVIVLDADMTYDLTVELLDLMRGGVGESAITFVDNDYKIGAGQTTRMYENQNHLFSDALATIEAGEKVFIATNDKALTRRLGSLIETTEKRVLVINSETADTEQCRAFILDPEAEAKNYDVVVASPTIATGVSIDGDNFKHVYGSFSSSRGTYQDADQAIARVRNCKNHNVWVQTPKLMRQLPSGQSIYDNAIEAEKGSVKVLHGVDQVLTQGQIQWAKIYTTIHTCVNSWSTDKAAQFESLREKHGYTVEHVPVDTQAADDMKAMLKLFQHTGPDHTTEVFQARQIGAEVAIELGRKRNLSHENFCELERYRICSILQIKQADLTFDLCEQAIDEDLLKNIKRIKALALTDRQSLKAWDERSRERNSQTFTANSHHVLREQLISELVGVAGIDIQQLYKDSIAGNEVVVTLSQLEALAKAFASKQQAFNFYFTARIKEPTNPVNYMKVWNGIFGEHLSLHLTKKRIRSKDFEGMKYIVNVEKKSLTHEVAATLEAD